MRPQADLNDLAFKLVRSDRNVGTDCERSEQLRKATIPPTDLVTIRFLVHKQRWPCLVVSLLL
jgi:hypothetical protein